MNDHLFNLSPSNDLLEMLRLCAHRLLLAYDETLLNDLWIAFEKTIDAFQLLTYKQNHYLSTTKH